MIVKPQTFKRGGRFSTARERAEYLQKDGRELGVATQNVNDEAKWWNELDRTTDRHHLRGDVVAREFVLSPSPEDNVTPEQMLKFGREWASKCFPDHEAAIIVHDDSTERLARGENGIVHAHVYVNAPNLETGKKMKLANADVRRNHDVAQDMCKQRGWNEQQRYYDTEGKKVNRLTTKRTDFERRPARERSARYKTPTPSAERQRERLKAFEHSRLAAKGLGYREYREAMSGRKLDKTAIRRALKESADAAAANGTTLKEELASRGVRMAHAANGDFKYAREGSKLYFKGATLGKAFARDALGRSISLGRQAIDEQTQTRGLGH